MLTFLRIKNFAIVAELELDFSSGMTAFTGETGAGKSIMIDALMLALGERADASIIRPGESSCDIQASFVCLPDSMPARWLAEHEVDNDEQQIVLRRIITSEGRSKAFVNGVPFPLQKIKELSSNLVHIHGQHAHQTLLSHTTHRQQLDDYAQHTSLCQAVSDTYRLCQKLEAERQKLISMDINQINDLQAQIEELQQLAPQDGEIETLHAEHQLLHHAKDYLEQSQYISDLIQAEEAPCIRHHLYQVTQALSALPQSNEHIASAKTLIDNALILCDEAYDDISAFSDKVQLDPERLMVLESRMSTLHHYARKYHIDVHQLARHVQTLEQEYISHAHAQQRLATIEHDLKAAQEGYHTAATQLRQSRQHYAKTLAAQITANIQQLGMPHGFITIEFTPLDQRHAHGMDKIEYKVSTNPGMKADLLTKIASGGELSRISLAIQMIAAQQGSTDTLLFDEVDVGIGGATAAIVGQLLRQLGERLQVFCVTHQPQVAASAHHHFEVKKHTDNQQTFSQITALTSEERIEEVARMLGGLSVTPQTRSHAQELLNSLKAYSSDHI